MIFVIRTVNEKLRGEVDLRALLTTEYARPEPWVEPDDLLDAMWLQFYWWVVGERDFKRCPICGKWEDVTKKRAAWKRHSECAANVRAKRSYERKKLLERVDSDASIDALTAENPGSENGAGI